MKRAVRLLLHFFGVWILLVAFVHNSYGEEKKEYALKAVCLYNFAQFTTWPDSDDSKKSESIIIGVVGHSPIEGAIKELQNLLKQSNKKNIKAVYHGEYKEGMDLSGSHLLFISASEKKNMHSIINSLKNAPILTVADTEDFLETGGMISLVLKRNKVRWKINRGTIENAGLQVSSKLLQLAILVEDNSAVETKLFPYVPEMFDFLLSLNNIALRTFYGHYLKSETIGEVWL